MYGNNASFFTVAKWNVIIILWLAYLIKDYILVYSKKTI